MQYLGDVWVNWFEGEENGYNVCEFHEWRKEDVIELLDQVPVLKIEPVLFDQIENDLADLPADLLADVHNKSFIRKNNQRQSIEYCFIAYDGMRILAVDTMGYRIPVRKSRLIPRQEQVVAEKMKDEKTSVYRFDNDRALKNFHILSPDPRWMRGLTRRERKLKQLLFMALDQLHASGTTAEVRYWYTEWVPKKYFEIQTMHFEEAWHQLYAELQIGWSDHHYDICERIIKGQPFFENLWEAEHGKRVNEQNH
ncbi:MAG TPA: YjbA family protein [Bacillales bacterium]|nr:YjbA family protein [Bacillales bacterium]